MPGDDDVLLSEQQVSELLQLHIQTVRNRRREGTGPKVTWVGRYPRYWRSDVLAWLESSQPGESEKPLPDRPPDRPPGRSTGKKG